MENKKKENPLVSVLMPCYNVEMYIEEAMNSILTQTYTNLEIIAINDCSTDNTRKILGRLAEQDNRIKVVDNEVNLKLIKTLNKGVELCSGEYIARMDADDISLPERIEKEVAFLEKNKDHDIVSTQFDTFKTGSNKRNPYINPTKYEHLQAFMLFKSGICHPASMLRKRVFTELNLKFESEYLHVEDYALWSKALYVTKIANIDGKALLHYRVHPSQVSSLNEDLQLSNKKKVFKIHCQQLGLDQSDKGLDIYTSVAEADPTVSSINYLTDCENFMLRLIQQNRSKAFCSSEYLESMLSMHWIRLCANSRIGLGVLKKCFASTLFKKENYSKRDILILYIKCIFRLRYKKSLVYKIVFR